MERKVEELEKRVSWLEAKVDDIEKTLYILIPSITVSYTHLTLPTILRV